MPVMAAQAVPGTSTGLLDVLQHGTAAVDILGRLSLRELHVCELKQLRAKSPQAQTLGLQGLQRVCRGLRHALVAAPARVWVSCGESPAQPAAVRAQPTSGRWLIKLPCAARCSGLSPQHPLFGSPDPHSYLAQQQRIVSSVLDGPASSTWRIEQWSVAVLPATSVAVTHSSHLLATTVKQPLQHTVHLFLLEFFDRTSPLSSSWQRGGARPPDRHPGELVLPAASCSLPLS